MEDPMALSEIGDCWDRRSDGRRLPADSEVSGMTDVRRSSGNGDLSWASDEPVMSSWDRLRSIELMMAAIRRRPAVTASKSLRHECERRGSDGICMMGSEGENDGEFEEWNVAPFRRRVQTPFFKFADDWGLDGGEVRKQGRYDERVGDRTSLAAATRREWARVISCGPI